MGGEGGMAREHHGRNCYYENGVGLKGLYRAFRWVTGWREIKLFGWRRKEVG
jgi:hypothetical protein